MRFEKLKNQLSHPICTDKDSDQSGKFIINMVDENLEKFDDNILEFTLDISIDWLEELVNKDIIELTAEVSCENTYIWSSHLIEATSGKKIINIDPYDFFGHTHLTVIASVKTEEYILDGNRFGNDFSGLKFRLNKGDIIGISNELKIDIRKEPDPANSSMFFLQKDKDTHEDFFRLDLELHEDKITILAGNKLFDQLEESRQQSDKMEELKNINSIYLPILAQTISIMVEEKERYEERDWYQSIASACPKIYESEDIDSLEVAQEIFNNPYINFNINEQELLD